MEPCLIRFLTIGAHHDDADDSKDHDDDGDAEDAAQSKFFSKAQPDLPE